MIIVAPPLKVVSSPAGSSEIRTSSATRDSYKQSCNSGGSSNVAFITRSNRTKSCNLNAGGGGGGGVLSPQIHPSPSHRSATALSS